MLTRFNHVAIVVPNLEDASKKYKNILGAKISEVYNYSDHGVSVVFVDLGNSKIELMQPYGNNSPIKNFLEKNLNGAIHHICLEVDDINAAIIELKKEKIILINDKPKIGAEGFKIVFIHPKSTGGVLVELAEKPS